jgi:23S rRNA (adenine2503-C2)-methyltransferase
VPTPKLKVQFARMGDPAFNDAVLEVLRRLPTELSAPGLMPCISTIAPEGREHFFAELLVIKRQLYGGGRFQMQFSLHTSSEEARRILIPAPTWSFARIAEYGRLFFEPGERKVALNFAPAVGWPLDPDRLARTFSPTAFLIKLTPINPTFAAARAGLVGLLRAGERGSCEELADRFRRAGFETLLSIGDLDENRIGSNCGMRARRLGEEAQGRA